MERASGAGGPHATTARDLVLGYIAALNAVDDAMKVAIPPLEQLADVIRLTRSHRLARSVQVGTYFYKVHGAGCRFISGNRCKIVWTSRPTGRRSSTSGGCAVTGRVCRNLLSPRIRICGLQWSC